MEHFKSKGNEAAMANLAQSYFNSYKEEFSFDKPEEKPKKEKAKKA